LSDAAHQNWQSLGAGGLWGEYVASGAVVGSRSPLDDARIKARTPEAEYPDGYLGAPPSRRSARLAPDNGMRGERAYQRGAHRGNIIEQSDYQWPRQFSPERNLGGRRSAPTGAALDAQKLANDGKNRRLWGNPAAQQRPPWSIG
jgi:hypothetical protein